MTVHILLLDAFQLVQVRRELVLADGHHLRVIEICLLKQFAEPTVEEDLANIGLSTQRTLVHLLLDDSGTYGVGKQSPP